MADNVEIRVQLDIAGAQRQADELRDRVRAAEDEARAVGDRTPVRPADRTGGGEARARVGASGRTGRGNTRRPAGAPRAGSPASAPGFGSGAGIPTRGDVAAGAAERLGIAPETLTRAGAGVARAGTAVAGGLAIQQAVGQGLSSAAQTASLAARTIGPEVIDAVAARVLPEAVAATINSDALAQAFSDQALQLSDEILQKFRFEVVTSQLARLEAVEILAPFARAGLPSGRMGSDDGSFTENLVRARRRQNFLERQEARRKGEAAVLFGIDFLLGG